jgi:hypothetical protein
MTIHSFRRVLKVRRSIHVIPWNPGKALVLPVPVPMLGVAYFAALEVMFFILSRLPIIGGLSHLPFKVWWVIPFWLTYWLLHEDFDGRMPHLWVRSWVAYRWRAKVTRAGVPVVEDGKQRGRVRWFHDEDATDLSRARVTGPATVHFQVPVRYRGESYEDSAMGLPAGHRMEVKP